MAAVAYAHVELRDGVPYISGTQTKVIEVALDEAGRGCNPAEIHAEHPHLSLGQIHGALAYYYDHRESLDREIADRQRRAEALRSGVGPQFDRSELETRLREQARSPQDRA